MGTGHWPALQELYLEKNQLQWPHVQAALGSLTRSQPPVCAACCLMHRDGRLHMLVLEHNEIQEIQHPVSGFESLRILSLNANRVVAWSAVDAMQG